MSTRKQGDIYSGPGDQEAQFHQAESPNGLDPWRRDYLKNKFWSFILGLIVFLVAAGVVWLLIQNYLSLQPMKASSHEDDIRRHSTVVSAHRLSVLTDWVIDFREPIDFDVEDVAFNTTWLKRAAYHVINGEQAYQNQDPTTARTEFNKALAIFPDIKGVHVLLGNLALTEEKWTDAIAAYEKAAKEEEQMTYRLASNLGAACIGAEQYGKAERYLIEASNLKANAPEAYKNLAILYRKTGDLDNASTFFEKYIELVPNDMDTMQSYAMYMTANRKWNKAAELLRKLNIEFPDVAPLFFLRAQAEVQLGNSAATIKSLKRGIQLVDSSYALAWLSKNDFDTIRDSKDFQDLNRDVQLGAEEQ